MRAYTDPSKHTPVRAKVEAAIAAHTAHLGSPPQVVLVTHADLLALGVVDVGGVLVKSAPFVPAHIYYSGSLDESRAEDAP